MQPQPCKFGNYLRKILLVFFTEREVDLFMDKYGNRGFFARLKFYVGCGISLIDRYKITEALRPSNDVEKIFAKAQVDGTSGLSVQEAHNALLAFGVDITQDQTNNLLRFRLRFLGDYVDFDTFYAMTSSGILHIHLNSPEAPASWKDVVLATQMIMDVLVNGIMGFLPKPTLASVSHPASSPKPSPYNLFVDESTNTKVEDAFDTVVVFLMVA
ncbi:unnamed protein product [Cochlearia groenlandica]